MQLYNRKNQEECDGSCPSSRKSGYNCYSSEQSMKIKEIEKGRKCEHCLKIGHTKDKCWKLHGRPTLGRGGRSNFNKTQLLGRPNSWTRRKKKLPTKPMPMFLKHPGILEILLKLLIHSIKDYQ